MKIYSQTGARFFVAAGALGSLLLTQGCIATRDWVKEQMDPLSSRVSTNEEKLTQPIIRSELLTTGRMESKASSVSSKVDWVNMKAD